jgi:hypothetical protein
MYFLNFFYLQVEKFFKFFIPTSKMLCNPFHPPQRKIFESANFNYKLYNIHFIFQLSKSFDPVEIEKDPESGPKGSKRAEDIRPEVEVVGEQDDERFWAKIPVIREKKKRGNQKETDSNKKKTKTG